MKSKLLKLLIENRGRAQPPAQRAVRADGASEATVYIYDPIVSDQWEAEYFGGVCPQDMVPLLAGLDVDVIHLRINSPGGSVFAAQAICTALKQHKAKIVAHIDGVAASAATVIACACDEVEMADGAMYMIHNGWMIAMGDKSDFLDAAALLEKIDGTIADTYAARTGKKREEMAALMDAETWFTADEAIAAGLADRKAETKAKAQAWNLSAYAKAPPPDPEPEQIANEEPADAGFFMSTANSNRLELSLIA
jgi:ATP-dependent Clp protease protease subunit